MRNGKATTKRGGASANAPRKLGDLQFTTCTYRHTIQMDNTIIRVNAGPSDLSLKPLRHSSGDLNHDVCRAGVDCKVYVL